jgi:flagellar secretion chaperone FliS
MWQNAHDAYLESRVLSASPLELVRLLYGAGIESVREARRCLAVGDIAGRSGRISKAHDILTELAASLDLERGGDLSRRLGQLYDYMQRNLIEANLRQEDGPLSEVLALLSTLSEGWQAVAPATDPRPEEPNRWSQPMAAEPATAYAALSCSF